MEQPDTTLEDYIQSVTRYYESGSRAYPIQREELISSKLSLDRLRENKKTAIVGPPGIGKTTLLDRLSLRLARNPGDIPIFVSLHNYTTSLTDLLDVSVQRFEEQLSYNKLRRKAQESMTLWLLLDGLDEIAPSVEERFEDDLSHIQDHLSKDVLVSTSRLALPPKPPFLGWNTHVMEPLTKEEVAEALNQLADEETVSQIMQRPDFLDIAKRPLFIESLATAYKMDVDVSDYVSKQVADYTFWRGHTKSLIPPDISGETIDSALSEIAFEFVVEQQEWLPLQEISTILEPYAESREIDLQHLLQGVTATDPIQVEERRIRFRHKSYRTGYCARKLLDSLNEESSFSTLLKVILATEDGKEVIEDLFLEASVEQRERIFSILSLESLVSLFKVIPDSTAETIRNTFIRSDLPSHLYDAFARIKRSLDRNDRRRRDIIVLAIHGFNTRGEWKNKLSGILNEETDGERFLYHPWDYGSYRWGLLNPIARRNKVKSFQRHYNSILEKYESRPEICAVAHSFGTYILGKALKRFPEVELDRILLLGSVMPRTYPWKKMKRKCRRVLNVIAQSDVALSLAQYVPGLGSAGKKGFLDNCSFFV